MPKPKFKKFQIIFIATDKCGVRQRNIKYPRVTGGHNSKSGEFPWMVRYGINVFTIFYVDPP